MIKVSIPLQGVKGLGTRAANAVSRAGWGVVGLQLLRKIDW